MAKLIILIISILPTVVLSIGGWSTTGSMNFARYSHTASILANGKVLVTGGRSGLLNYDIWNSTELYDPLTGLWTMTGRMSAVRYQHTASVLANGKVLVAGGCNDDVDTQYSWNTTELYDPLTRLWAMTGSMNTGRLGHSASVLVNGKVLVAGGKKYDYPYNSTELYDPTTGRWTMTGSMNTGRLGHTASVLTNGKVLVVGGSYYDGYNYDSLNSTDLYDPSTGLWTMTRSMGTARSGHTASVLANGKVLIAGGNCNNGSYISVFNSAELYDPSTGLWKMTSSMGTARSGHTASVLANGKVLIAGGVVFYGYNYYLVNSTELYDPATGLWTNAGNMVTAQSGHTASLLASGTVLTAGGVNGFASLSRAELYA